LVQRESTLSPKTLSIIVIIVIIIIVIINTDFFFFFFIVVVSFVIASGALSLDSPSPHLRLFLARCPCQ